MENLVHLGTVSDGSIVEFPHSACYYMKVCDRWGGGGVVEIFTGKYIHASELETEGLGIMCHIAFDDIVDMYKQ